MQVHLGWFCSVAVPLTAGLEFSSAAQQHPEAALGVSELLQLKFNEEKGCTDFPLHLYITMLTCR